MPGSKEIRTKIKSVQNTRKVTRALEMVSASKIRKAQDKMKSSRPYARLMKQVVGHVAKAIADYVLLVDGAEASLTGDDVDPYTVSDSIEYSYTFSLTGTVEELLEDPRWNGLGVGRQPQRPTR